MMQIITTMAPIDPLTCFSVSSRILACPFGAGSGAEFHWSIVVGAIDSDFPIRVNLPPPPATEVRTGDANHPRLVHAIIGNGGPSPCRYPPYRTDHGLTGN